MKTFTCFSIETSVRQRKFYKEVSSHRGFKPLAIMEEEEGVRYLEQVVRSIKAKCSRLAGKPKAKQALVNSTSVFCLAVFKGER